MDTKKVEIPQFLKGKLDNLQSEIDQLVELAKNTQRTNITGSVSFKYEIGAPRDILTDFERAQSVCFVTRYEGLPILNDIAVAEHRGRYYLGNIDFIKHILNEYRAIIQNTKDSVHYQKVHKFCRAKLTNRDMSKDLVITVNNEVDADITDTFTKYLDEKIKVITIVLNHTNYGYIYNGILQHSDHRFTKRFLKEYSSGEINYIFIKHAKLLGYIKDCLFWHYKLLNAITFPKLGPL